MIPLRYTRNLFLRSLCIVYLFAFISFYIQIPGLYGDNGILPAKSLLENSKHKTFSAKVHYQPTLLWLAPYLGLDTAYALDVLALLGAFLAFTGIVSQKFCTVPLFAGLWSLYFSVYQIGQVFVSTNFDEFLLEAGFLTLLVAPLLPGRRKVKSSPTDPISLWLVKWLLFRFLLTCGISKLISGCPKWWDLTAFNYHFLAMPLPCPLSWYSHHLSDWILKLTAVYANVCEIALPFLFFVPIRSVRITGFVFQLFLQITIVLTGNYSFTPMLVVSLLLSLLDDEFFYGRKKSQESSSVWGILANIVIHGALIYAVINLYTLRINGTVIDAKIAFTKDQFDNVLKQGLIFVTYFGVISLGLTIFKALTTALFNSPTNQIGNILSTLFYAALAFLLFMASTVPLSSLNSSTNSTVHPTVRTIYNRLHKLHAVNQYGLFKKMTALEGRPEIIIEGANNVEGPWKEYNFMYKPGNVNHTLPFVAPYSPRIDWQMYWAAYSTYEKQPWILSLAHRLLINSPEALVLFDVHSLPFRQQGPPKFIRGVLYNYKYTQSNERSKAWFTREKVSEYFPAFSKDSATLIDYLKARNLLPVAGKSKVNPLWKNPLDTIRYLTSHLEPSLLLWSIITAACAIITISGGNNGHQKNK